MIPQLGAVDQHIARLRAAVLAIPEDAAEAEVIAELEAAERRREAREARRSWSPPWRCDNCHGYTASAQAVCPQCGHVGSSNSEGHRTSYDRAHARRRRRLSGRRR
jgi:rubrerythrin